MSTYDPELEAASLAFEKEILQGGGMSNAEIPGGGGGTDPITFPDVAAWREAQYAEIMRLADEYAGWKPADQELFYDERAALDAAVRKLAGLPANSEAVARPGTE